jgi:maltose O-acetyltransferase
MLPMASGTDKTPSAQAAAASTTARDNGGLRWAVAYILYYGFARHLPASYRPYGFGARRLRYWLVKNMFASCGKNVNVEHGADVGSGRTISIGDNSGIGVDCRVPGPVAIGANVMMGPEVVIQSAGHSFDRTDIPMIEQGETRLPVVIEDDVWIGTRAIILPGRRIGRGSIVGAGAIVTKDVAAYTIVAGNPAVVVGRRERPLTA